MEEKLSSNLSVHEEKYNGKNVFIVECAELEVSDFGETINEALNNLKLGINLLLEETSEKKELLIKPKPLIITKLFL